ncbi:MAG: ABC transporter permease [Lachnospiraceae bacterium]|nr:ABC transporter permease [Lachnospiraceae bacterium]
MRRLLNGKRIGKEKWMLLCIFILLSISGLLIFMNINGRAYVEELNRGYYSTHTERIDIFEVTDKEGVSKDIADCLKENPESIVFRNGLEPNLDLRGVAAGTEVEEPYLRSGRFFTSEECFAKEPLAVVGADFLKEHSDSKEYIEIGGIKCKVIGILGVRKASRYDKICLINMSTALKAYGEAGDYFVDAKDENVTYNAAFRLGELLQQHCSDVSSSVKERVGFAGLLEEEENNNTTINTIYEVILLSFLLTSFAGMGFWIRHRNQQIQVKKFLGVRDRTILKELLAELLGMEFVAFLISVGIVVALQIWVIEYPLHILDCLKTFVLIVAINSIFALCFVFGKLFSKSVNMKRI